ncbi:MAG: hypothetical protein AABY15_01815 [Nanoarchaeota archaeon]
MKRFLLTLLVVFIANISLAKEVVTQTEKYENGNIKYEIISVNDGDYYKYKLYYENGQIQTSGYYNWLGVKTWDWVVYYENGVVAFTQKFADGEKNGDCYYYNENGTLYIKTSWKNDKKHGTWLQYDETGRLVCTKTYKRDKFIEGCSWSEDKGLLVTYP